MSLLSLLDYCLTFIFYFFRIILWAYRKIKKNNSKIIKKNPPDFTRGGD